MHEFERLLSVHKFQRTNTKLHASSSLTFTRTRSRVFAFTPSVHGVVKYSSTYQHPGSKTADFCIRPCKTFILPPEAGFDPASCERLSSAAIRTELTLQCYHMTQLDCDACAQDQRLQLNLFFFLDIQTLFLHLVTCEKYFNIFSYLKNFFNEAYPM